jgi:hypothetical protein
MDSMIRIYNGITGDEIKHETIKGPFYIEVFEQGKHRLRYVSGDESSQS